jgi:hypothetical protein
LWPDPVDEVPAPAGVVRTRPEDVHPAGIAALVTCVVPQESCGVVMAGSSSVFHSAGAVPMARVGAPRECGVGRANRPLITSTRPPAEQANQRGWWESFSGTIPNWLEVLASLEPDADVIWTYEAEFVPGLFQTEDYARAIRQAWSLGGVDERMDQFVRSPC